MLNKNSTYLLVGTAVLVLGIASCGDDAGKLSKKITPAGNSSKEKVDLIKPKPQIDLAVVAINSPTRVSKQSNFNADVTVKNHSNSTVNVASIDLRIQINNVNGTTSFSAGSGVVRNIGPSQQKVVTVNGRAPTKSGLGKLTAMINPVLAKDVNLTNNTTSMRLIVD